MSSTGQITSGISLGQVALQTIDFVYKQLLAWRDDPDRPAEETENKLNLQLCEFLDVQARDKFPMVHFKTEKPQTGQRKIDLAASPVERMVIEGCLYTKYDPVLVLEGKRLPAPSTDRQKEYVTGHEKESGGIQRFKLGVHGAKLSVAAMVGYVQKGTLSDWYNKINEWILELETVPAKDGCTWFGSDKLTAFDEQPSAELAHYCSSHNRIGDVTSSTIILHHLWIIMNKTNLSKQS